MHLTKPLVDDPEVELASLARKHVGLIHQRRLEWLDRSLKDAGPVAVRHSHAGFCGDRLTAWLDDGSVLTLKLLRPNRTALAVVCSVAWRPSVCWVIEGRSTAGERLLLYAWQARLFR